MHAYEFDDLSVRCSNEMEDAEFLRLQREEFCEALAMILDWETICLFTDLSCSRQVLEQSQVPFLWVPSRCCNLTTQSVLDVFNHGRNPF